MIKLLIAIFALGGFAYVGYEFTRGYIAAAGYNVSVFHRLVLATEGSATLLWGRFVVAVSAVGIFLVNIADYFNLPGVAAVIPNYFNPQTVMLLMAGIAVVSELARRRTL